MTTAPSIEIPTPSGLWRTLAERKRTVFGIVAAFLAVGLAINLFTPPVYRASVRVEFPDGARSPWSGDPAQTRNFQSENVALFTSAELITNRVLLGKLAVDMSRSEPTMLARGPETVGKSQHWLTVPIARASGTGNGAVQYDPVALDARVDRLAKEISVQPVADTRLVDIRVEDGDPVMAKEAADRLAASFVEWQRSRAAQADTSGLSFVTAEIARVQDRIEATSAELAKYGPRTTYQRVKTYRRATQTSDKDLQRAQADLSEALQSYREGHPRVRELRSQVAALRSQSAGGGLIASYETRPVTRVVSSPKQAVLENDLAIDEALYARLQSRAKEIGLQREVMTPAVAIVQPATLEPDPVRPRPLLNMAVSLLAGLFVAVGIALVQGSLSRTIRTAVDAERLTGLPVLAVLPRRA
jgi:uncharacterized protein involved in exopolysaccharide biosynthesis